MSDRDRRYRTREEEAQWRTRDPINAAAGVLRERFDVTLDGEALRAEVATEVQQAIEWARAEELPGPEAVHNNVYAD